MNNLPNLCLKKERCEKIESKKILFYMKILYGPCLLDVTRHIVIEDFISTCTYLYSSLT
jgi:hypothetical protein